MGVYLPYSPPPEEETDVELRHHANLNLFKANKDKSKSCFFPLLVPKPKLNDSTICRISSLFTWYAQPLEHVTK